MTLNLSDILLVECHYNFIDWHLRSWKWKIVCQQGNQTGLSLRLKTKDRIRFTFTLKKSSSPSSPTLTSDLFVSRTRNHKRVTRITCSHTRHFCRRTDPSPTPSRLGVSLPYSIDLCSTTSTTRPGSTTRMKTSTLISLLYRWVVFTTFPFPFSFFCLSHL